MAWELVGFKDWTSDVEDLELPVAVEGWDNGDETFEYRLFGLHGTRWVRFPSGELVTERDEITRLRTYEAARQISLGRTDGDTRYSGSWDNETLEGYLPE